MGTKACRSSSRSPGMAFATNYRWNVSVSTGTPTTRIPVWFCSIKIVSDRATRLNMEENVTAEKPTTVFRHGRGGRRGSDTHSGFGVVDIVAPFPVGTMCSFGGARDYNIPAILLWLSFATVAFSSMPMGSPQLKRCLHANDFIFFSFCCNPSALASSP